MFEVYFKRPHFGSNRMYPKLNLKVKLKINFRGQFIYPCTPGKPKMLVKTKISPETKFSGLSNNINSKSQKNPRILVKLIQNKKKCDREEGGWGGGGRLSPGTRANVEQKLSHSL